MKIGDFSVSQVFEVIMELRNPYFPQLMAECVMINFVLSVIRYETKMFAICLFFNFLLEDLVLLFLLIFSFIFLYIFSFGGGCLHVYQASLNITDNLGAAKFFYSVSAMLLIQDANDVLRRSPGTPVFTAPECCLG